jgi:coenzyme F420-reducing hydrogenase gamma subunit
MTQETKPEAARPRLAFFDFSCCEGCQLQVINLETDLIPIVGQVDIVQFREAMTEKSDQFDIAIVEGSITRKSEIPRLQAIRKQAGVVVALGACAHLGGINCLKNRFGSDYLRDQVYPGSDHAEDTISARPLSAVIRVNYAVPGCPIDRVEFLRLVTSLLLGRPFRLPDYTVCTECKLRENVCQFDLGETCLGPVIRGGCNAICPAFGRPCDGCRGFVDDPKLTAHAEVLKKHGLTAEELMRSYTLFTEYQIETDGPVRVREEVPVNE